MAPSSESVRAAQRSTMYMAIYMPNRNCNALGVSRFISDAPQVRRVVDRFLESGGFGAAGPAVLSNPRQIGACVNEHEHVHSTLVAARSSPAIDWCRLLYAVGTLVETHRVEIETLATAFLLKAPRNSVHQ
jgi:hypothetical protein